MDKCKFPDGIVIKPDGVNELDPCIYEDIQVIHNVTVTVAKCKKCGYIDIAWKRQEDSWEEDLSEFGDEPNRCEGD